MDQNKTNEPKVKDIIPSSLGEFPSHQLVAYMHGVSSKYVRNFASM